MAKKTKEEVITSPELKTREVNNATRKVYFASGKKDKNTPKLLIEGAWLLKYGFAVGKTYKLTPANGNLVLELNG